MQEPTWNEPKQERSRQRFEHILDVSQSMFAELGYEVITTNHIAAEANVSIGALYRFFPNKEAILHALIHRYQVRMAVAFPKKYDISRPYADVLGDLIQHLMYFDKQEAAFTHIFVHVDEDITRTIHQAIVGEVSRLIGTYHPQLKADDLHLCATVGVGIVRGLMPLTQAPNNLPREQVALELKRALLAYLGAFLRSTIA